MQLINEFITANSRSRKGDVNYLVLIYILLTMVNFIV